MCFSGCHSLEQAESHLIARPITVCGNCTAGSDADSPSLLSASHDILVEEGYEILKYMINSRSPNVSANEEK